MADDPPPTGSPWRMLISLGVLILCVLLGLFVWNKVSQMAATQDCVASGRRDCLAVPSGQ